ncbi:YktB family protein [Ornithinibacillus halotolerans]|uniref:UPF0637 protein GCM10008025_28330 n=1 Tax=Ornithinibacillus halotolerans TaxID=1274357 RepID=A0A916S4S2_9BACI|nr:DUF1054 domain-containing protein [Ornithinibacillus halotolerans]GGA83528.1 UPF0637 protein [Ornithinibacillus halotolerans]
MGVTGFVQADFQTFDIDGLEERMEAIQGRIQPKFREIGQELVDYLSIELGNEVFLHIAKHARRTVNPPKDTWLAISNNKRGYKKHPHFQVGLFDDHLFIWLACIYELDKKSEIAKSYLNHFDKLKQLPSDFVISLDHMKKDSLSIVDLEKKHIERFRDVKKGEFLIGRHLSPNDPIVSDGDKLLTVIKETYESLIPFYQLAIYA